MAPRCLLALSFISSLSVSRTPCLDYGAAQSGVSLPTSVKTNPHNDTHRPTEYRQPLIETLFSGESRLDEADDFSFSHFLKSTLRRIAAASL